MTYERLIGVARWNWREAHRRGGCERLKAQARDLYERAELLRKEG